VGTSKFNHFAAQMTTHERSLYGDEMELCPLIAPQGDLPAATKRNEALNETSAVTAYGSEVRLSKGPCAPKLAIGGVNCQTVFLHASCTQIWTLYRRDTFKVSETRGPSC